MTEPARCAALPGDLFAARSIANIILADRAGRIGMAVSWREHARIGAPAVVAMLAIAAARLARR